MEEGEEEEGGGGGVLVEEDQEVETDEVDYEYLTIGSSFQPIVLWSALREAINKIETLEAKVLALENP